MIKFIADSAYKHYRATSSIFLKQRKDRMKKKGLVSLIVSLTIFTFSSSAALAQSCPTGRILAVQTHYNHIVNPNSYPGILVQLSSAGSGVQSNPTWYIPAYAADTAQGRTIYNTALAIAVNSSQSWGPLATICGTFNQNPPLIQSIEFPNYASGVSAVRANFRRR